MDAAVGGPPPQGGPWPARCQLDGVADAETPALGSVQTSHGGTLQPAAPFGGIEGILPAAGPPYYPSVAPMNVGSAAPKGMEQTTMAPGGPIGNMGMQTDTPEGPTMDPWMMLPQQHVQQQFYCEGQSMLQQQIQQQRQPGLPRGPQGGDASALRLGDGTQWATPMDYAAEGSGGFGYGSPCMLPTQASAAPYGVSPMPTGSFAADQPMMGQPHVAAWQTAEGGEHNPMQGLPVASRFGMCMSASSGGLGRLPGNPEAPGSGGPWYPMQQQPLGEHAAAPTSYCTMREALPANSKAAGKSSRQNQSGAARRRCDTAADGGPGGATTGGQASTRPAKFFKQHSPARAALKAKGKAGGPPGSLLGGAAKGPTDGPMGCTAPLGQAAVGALVNGGCKPGSGPLEGGEAEAGAPKPAPRSRAGRPSEVMAKMYFHRKKEAWRAELLIEGTKKQKSFSCRLYGYERARLMCEWARKFVLRTSRLPTDEETCTSLASLMKEPLPTQVPPALPCMGGDYTAPPHNPEAPFACARGAQGPLHAKAKNFLLNAEQQANNSTAMNPNSTGIGGATGEATTPALSGAKGPHEPQGLAPGLSKKRKESAKTGETMTKVRKGSGAQGGASAKKGHASRGASDSPSDPAFMGTSRVEEPDMLGVGNARQTDSTDSKPGEPAQQLLSPYFAFPGGESATTAPYETSMPVCGSPELQELPQVGALFTKGGESLPGTSQQEEVPSVGELSPCKLEQGPHDANPWFEELEQLKKVSRPKGGRAKRFNVGKKPFSGVRGIYFQQGLWKVKYRGDQEEAMKLFPYSPGDEKDMKSQFELARSFLRQVIDKGRHLHDSDGEGLSEDEPAWLVRSTSSSKWTYRKETQLPSARTEQPQRPRSPNGAANRRRAPTASKGPRHSAGSESFRGGTPSATDEGQTLARAPNYFQRPPLQLGGAFFSKGLPFSANGVTFPPHNSGAVSSWPQRTLPEGQAEEFQGDDVWGHAASNGPEGQNLWSHPSDFGVAEVAASRPTELSLHIMPCGGVFTTADSPMSHQASFKDKPAFPQEGSTGFFSAVTTTTDEAIPLGACSTTNLPSDMNDSATPGITPKLASALYHQNHIYCQTGTTQAKDKASTAALCASFPAEGPASMPQPMNLNVQASEVSVPSGSFTMQSHMQPSSAASRSSHFPLNRTSGHAPPFHPSEGTLKGAECSLQFRPFAEQHTRHLEASLGEELLSVASYPCSFGGVIEGSQSPGQQLGGEAPAFPSMEASGDLAVAQDQPPGTSSSHIANPQMGPWGLESPLAVRKSKEEVLSGDAAIKPEPLECGGVGVSPCEIRGQRRQVALPWVVVIPREEEEKALTPIAGNVVGCFLQGSPTRCKYIQQHAN